MNEELSALSPSRRFVVFSLGMIFGPLLLVVAWFASNTPRYHAEVRASAQTIASWGPLRLTRQPVAAAQHRTITVHARSVRGQRSWNFTVTDQHPDFYFLTRLKAGDRFLAVMRAELLPRSSPAEEPNYLKLEPSP